MVMRQSLYPRSTSMRTVSSRAINLAQPMSLPSDNHHGMSFHATHWVPMTTPMPQFVDASTHISGLIWSLGNKDRAMQGTYKIACHQCKLSITSLGTWCQMKSLGNLDRNDERGGKNAWPSQYMKVMHWSVLWIERHSLCDIFCVALDRKSETLDRYLVHFL